MFPNPNMFSWCQTLNMGFEVEITAEELHLPYLGLARLFQPAASLILTQAALLGPLPLGSS